MVSGYLDNYKNLINETFDSVGRAIGVHVMLLVVEHALWTTKHKYEEASFIRFSETGICLDELDQLEPAKANIVAHDFIMAIVSTLGRLVGINLANELIDKFKLSSEEGQK